MVLNQEPDLLGQVVPEQLRTRDGRGIAPPVRSRGQSSAACPSSRKSRSSAAVPDSMRAPDGTACRSRRRHRSDCAETLRTSHAVEPVARPASPGIGKFLEFGESGVSTWWLSRVMLHPRKARSPRTVNIDQSRGPRCAGRGSPPRPGGSAACRRCSVRIRIPPSGDHPVRLGRHLTGPGCRT